MPGLTLGVAIALVATALFPAPVAAEPEGLTPRYSATLAGDLVTVDAAHPLLTLPAEATVTYARLYWWDRLEAGGIGSTTLTTPSGPARIAGPLREVDGGYQSAVDVTDLVGAGSYTAAAAGWTLAVAYRAPGQQLRRLAVADGLARGGELLLGVAGPTRVAWVAYAGAPTYTVADNRAVVTTPGWLGAIFATVDYPIPTVTVSAEARPDPSDLFGHPVLPGTLVTMTYALTVADATAFGVVLFGTLPEHTTYVPGSASAGLVASGRLFVYLGDLPAGTARAVTLRTRIDDDAGGAAVRGEATAVHAAGRAAPGVSEPFAVTPAANLIITSTPPAAGDWTWRLKVTNQGPSAAEGVVVRDTIFPALGAPDAAAGCSYTNDLLTCALGRIAAGATVEVPVTLHPARRPNPGTSVPNAASVEATTLDPDPADNTAVTVVTL